LAAGQLERENRRKTRQNLIKIVAIDAMAAAVQGVPRLGCPAGVTSAEVSDQPDPDDSGFTAPVGAGRLVLDIAGQLDTAESQFDVHGTASRAREKKSSGDQPIRTVGQPTTIDPPCAVGSPRRAAGMLPIKTVGEPMAITSGGPTQTAMSVARA